MPEWLGSLTALTTLNLGNRAGVGAGSLGNLTALTRLDLSINQAGRCPSHWET